MLNEFFKIEKFEHITKFTNNSKYTILISILPKKPKRKYEGWKIIQGESWLIDENDIDMSSISIRFEKLGVL